MNTETKPALPALVSGGQIRAIVPQTFEEAWRIANAIAKAGMSPPGLESPEKITIALMAGLEIGLPPMQAIQSIAVINNRPSLYGDGPIALVRASGLLVEMRETIEGQGDAMVAKCMVRRRGENVDVVKTFSVADAKKAGLWGKKGPWDFYPTRMLAVRARAFALRDAFADVLRGLAIAEEQADIVKAAAPQPGPPPDDAIPDFGDSVLEQEAGAKSPPQHASAGALPTSGLGSDQVAPENPPSDSVAATLAPFRKSEAIGKLLQLASDTDITEDERIESLDQVWKHYEKLFEGDDSSFLQELFGTASKVARGQLKVDSARKYLEGL
jgi:hypothetical protein